jgi:pyruvate dehydrogenase E2 component (dihydrolipoamide acetyltransferase)
MVPNGASDIAVGTPVAVLVEEASDVGAFSDYVAISPVVNIPTSPSSPPAASPPPAVATATTMLAPAHSGRVPRIQFRHGRRSEIDAIMGRFCSSAAPAAAASPAASPAAAVASPGDARGFTDIKLTAMRKIIAARLTESKATIPHFYTRMECNIDMMLEYRKTLKNAGVKVSVNDLVIVAAALALRDVPEANSFWDGSMIQQNPTVDISVAVATDGGLITPIVKDADRIGLSVSFNFVLIVFLF